MFTKSLFWKLKGTQLSCNPVWALKTVLCPVSCDTIMYFLFIIPSSPILCNPSPSVLYVSSAQWNINVLFRFPFLILSSWKCPPVYRKPGYQGLASCLSFPSGITVLYHSLLYFRNQVYFLCNCPVFSFVSSRRVGVVPVTWT